MRIGGEVYGMTDNSTEEMVSHYNQADEASRLRTGWFQLEQARTQELILRYIPPPPAHVLDIGGGAGAYTLDVRASSRVTMHGV